MKLFFVGDGRHDVGPDPNQLDAFPARGVVPALVRRLGVDVDEDSVAKVWRGITLFSSPARGYERKARAATLLARRVHGCEAAVLVVDNDRKDGERRLDKLKTGAARGEVPAVCGLAVESIEAWTLGAPTAIAAELGVPASDVRAAYPRRSVEELYEGSGKEELRPKDLLEAIAKLAHRHDGLEFREAVAARTDIRELEASCPLGFKPFADEVRQHLGVSNEPTSEQEED